MVSRIAVLVVFLTTILCGQAWGANCGGAVTCACGDTVTSSYTLPGNLSCTNAGAALTIGAASVTLNLGGYAIAGDGTNTTYGIVATNRASVVITNGTVSGGFLTNSIRLSGANPTVSSLTVSGNDVGSAIYMNASTGTITLASITVSNIKYYGLLAKLATDSTWNITNYSVNTTTSATGDNHGMIVNVNSATGVTLNVSGASVTGSANCGLYVYGPGTFTAASIAGNFYSNTAHGVFIQNAAGPVTVAANSYLNTASGIVIDGATTTGVAIAGSNVYSNGVDGISFSNAATGEVKRNRIYSNGTVDAAGNGDGVTAHTGTVGLLIAYNLIYQNKNSCIGMVNDAAGSAYNNTCYQNGVTGTTNLGVRGGFYSSSTGAWIVKNNIFSGNYPNEIRTDANGISGYTATNNQFYHVGNGVTEAEMASYDLGSTTKTWVEHSGAYDTNSQYGDPLFLSATNYRLKPNSPARNAGTSPCTGSGAPLACCTGEGTDDGTCTDYSGRPKNKATWDIGAYWYKALGASGQLLLWD